MGKKGFTLIELSAVMLLIVLMIGISLPNFSNLFDSNVMREIKTLASRIKIIRAESIATGKEALIKIDPEKNYYQILIASQNIFRPHAKYQQPIPFPSNIHISEIRIGETAIDSTIEPQLTKVQIRASGFVDPLFIKLHNQKTSVSMQVVNINGKIKINREVPYQE